MSTRLKFILTYIGGIITGVVLVLFFSFVQQQIIPTQVLRTKI